MLFLSVFGLSAIICITLIFLLLPFMQNYALARPNARSSHSVPTPQGGGIAVLGAMFIVVIGMLNWFHSALLTDTGFIAVAVATMFLAVIGAIDDITPIEAVPRLLAHGVSACAVVIFGLGGMRIFPAIPSWLELGILTLAVTWFVNLTNFMDGLDLIVVAAKLPILVALAVFSLGGFIPPWHGLVATALAGALLGFVPFNRPVAKLFLGDVGSLPIGLIVGWLLMVLASNGHLIAAMILPLYFCADATITLCRRLARKERVWVAHRTHFYQQATNNGYSALQVSSIVFGLNIFLAGAAGITLLYPYAIVFIGASLLSILLLALCLLCFSRPRAN